MHVDDISELVNEIDQGPQAFRSHILRARKQLQDACTQPDLIKGEANSSSMFG